MRKLWEVSYLSSSENADGSMSMMGSSAILAASAAASGFNLIPSGTEPD